MVKAISFHYLNGIKRYFGVFWCVVGRYSGGCDSSTTAGNKKFNMQNIAIGPSGVKCFTETYDFLGVGNAKYN